MDVWLYLLISVSSLVLVAFTNDLLVREELTDLERNRARAMQQELVRESQEFLSHPYSITLPTGEHTYGKENTSEEEEALSTR